MPHDLRNEMVDFVRHWSERTGLVQKRLVRWLGIRPSRYYDWRQRYGRVSVHSGKVPRDFWLEPWKRTAVAQFHGQYPLEGYRRLTFMMLDRDGRR